MKARLGSVRPARAYKPVDDLWVVAAYFNFNRYRSKLDNLKSFAQSLDQSGLNHLLVECALPRRPFALPAAPNTLRLRCDSVVWQKERLLNLAVSKLPESCRKVAWLDADVLFSDPDWAVKTSKALEQHPLVQPYDTAIRLPPATRIYAGEGDVYSSFAYVLSKKPGMFLAGNLVSHGHTGFAWAAKRELLERHRLYDFSVSGGGDHLMAHGFCGDLASPCVRAMVGWETPYSDSFKRWATKVYGEVQSDIGWVPGKLLHLWHGERANRRYDLRTRELLELGYDPRKHVRVGHGGAWQWGDESSALRDWAEEYFRRRKEDTQVKRMALLSGR